MSQSLKIAIDARALEGRPGGVGRYLSNLLKYFGNPEFLKEIFGGNPPIFQLYFKHEIPRLEVLQSSVFLKRRLQPIFGRESNTMFTHFLLPKALRKDGTEVLFAPSYVAPLWGTKNLVLALHDIPYEAHPEWVPRADRFFLRYISKRAAYRARHIIVPSEFSKEEVMRLYGIHEERIAAIPLAADPIFKQIVDAAEEKQVLDKFGTEPLSQDATASQRRFLLFVGHLINRRHPLEMISAFAAIGKEFPDLSLLLIGPDRTYPALNVRQEIKQANKLLGRFAVRHAPFANDRELSVLYRKASCFLWPSSYEGFGLPPLEALSLGTPVITSHASSLPEVVGDAALRLAEPITAPTLTDAIRSVLKDGLLRGHLKEKADEQAKKFSWERTARETLRILRQTTAV